MIYVTNARNWKKDDFAAVDGVFIGDAPVMQDAFFNLRTQHPCRIMGVAFGAIIKLKAEILDLLRPSSWSIGPIPEKIQKGDILVPAGMESFRQTDLDVQLEISHFTAPDITADMVVPVGANIQGEYVVGFVVCESASQGQLVLVSENNLALPKGEIIRLHSIGYGPAETWASATVY